LTATPAASANTAMCLIGDFIRHPPLELPQGDEWLPCGYLLGSETAAIQSA
jgi:hypothetical protein